MKWMQEGCSGHSRDRKGALGGSRIAHDDTNTDASCWAGIRNLIAPERDDKIECSDFEWDK